MCVFYFFPSDAWVTADIHLHRWVGLWAPCSAATDFCSSGNISARVDNSCVCRRGVRVCVCACVCVCVCVCVLGGGGGGYANRKSLTTNCPPLDQLSHRNQACLHKCVPPVFTASAHFCFTMSKLLRCLFCFTWTVSVRATLADESSWGWQAGGSARMHAEGYTGSGRFESPRHRNARAWTFNKFFNNMHRLPPVQRKRLPEATP